MPLTYVVQPNGMATVSGYAEGLDQPTAVGCFSFGRTVEDHLIWVGASDDVVPLDELQKPDWRPGLECEPDDPVEDWSYTPFDFEVRYFYDPYADPAVHEAMQGSNPAHTYYVGLVQCFQYHVNGLGANSVHRPNLHDDIPSIDADDPLDPMRWFFFNAYDPDDCSPRIPFFAYWQLEHTPNATADQLTAFPQRYGGLVRLANTPPLHSYRCATIAQPLSLHASARADETEQLVDQMARRLHQLTDPSQYTRHKNADYRILVGGYQGNGYKEETKPSVRRFSFEQCLWADTIQRGWVWIEEANASYRAHRYCKPGDTPEVVRIRCRPLVSGDASWVEAAQNMLEKSFEVPPPDPGNPADHFVVHLMAIKVDKEVWIAPIDSFEERLAQQRVDPSVWKGLFEFVKRCSGKSSIDSPVGIGMTTYTYPVLWCQETGEWGLIRNGVEAQFMKLYDIENNLYSPIGCGMAPCPEFDDTMYQMLSAYP